MPFAAYAVKWLPLIWAGSMAVLVLYGGSQMWPF
jgi:hypothetical protein